MSRTDSTNEQQRNQASPDLSPLPEDCERALATVAHPDDRKYRATTAVARCTAMGKDLQYVLATRGEASIDESPDSGMFVLTAQFDQITGAHIATALTAKERQPMAQTKTPNNGAAPNNT